MRKRFLASISIVAIVCMGALAFPVNTAEPTISVRIVKYGPDGTVLDETHVTYLWMEGNLPVYGDGITHYYHQGPVFEWPPGPWDEGETANYKLKGAVKGTNIKDLCELVGGMSPCDEVKVASSDGFSQWFDYSNIYEPEAQQGPVVMGWYRDGSYVTDYDDGMQLVFFADNSTNPHGYHIFGNQDMRECFAPKYWHNFSAVYPSSNGLSVKYCDEVAIYCAPPVDWTLELAGALTRSINKKTFEDGVACHGVSYTDQKNRTWEGIPLWYLLGWVDDANAHGHDAFNDAIGDIGYGVTIISGDGYQRTFSSKLLARNDDYIVACYLNGTELPELDDKGKPLAPLKLVGEEVSGGNRVSNIARIVLDIAPAQEEKLTLIGDETRSFTMDEVWMMPSCTADGGYKKSTGTIVGPHTYTGIDIAYLANLVGRIAPSISIKVTASDGYSMTYSYDQIMGDLTTYNGAMGEEAGGPVTMILAYEENGKSIPYDRGGPLRIAFVGPESPITDGHFWIKQVNKIEILGSAKEWDLTLRGAITEVMDRSTFESGVGCHGVSWTDDKGRTWRGIPLWMLVGCIDDDEEHDFSDAVADKGYNIALIAGDGYSLTLESTFIKRNADIIVANELNGKILSDKYWPLRLVGPALARNEMIANICEIVIPDFLTTADDGTHLFQNLNMCRFGTISSSTLVGPL